MNFSDRLIEQIKKKDSYLVVGMDPIEDRLPPQLFGGIESYADAAAQFAYAIIDSCAEYCIAFKPNSAYFEFQGESMAATHEKIVNYAKSAGLLVIDDSKRTDIGKTVKQYAKHHLGHESIDSMTCTYFAGDDSFLPFVEEADNNEAGLFALLKTTNPGSADLQERLIQITNQEARDLVSKGVEVVDTFAHGGYKEMSDTPERIQLAPVYAMLANKFREMGKNIVGDNGYSDLGLVVGAQTNQRVVRDIRAIYPNCFFLVPGYGSQGGSSFDVVKHFDEKNLGAIVNSTSGIIYAWQKADNPREFAKIAGEQAKKDRDYLNSALAQR